jgi:hypothetical protein
MRRRFDTERWRRGEHSAGELRHAEHTRDDLLTTWGTLGVRVWLGGLVKQRGDDHTEPGHHGRGPKRCGLMKNPDPSGDHHDLVRAIRAT